MKDREAFLLAMLAVFLVGILFFPIHLLGLITAIILIAGTIVMMGE